MNVRRSFLLKRAKVFICNPRNNQVFSLLQLTDTPSLHGAEVVVFGAWE